MLGVLLHQLLIYLSRLYLEQFQGETEGQKTLLKRFLALVGEHYPVRLLHTGLPVNQIGEQLGFEDAAYFNRFFKRHTGQTPLSYRKQIREKYHYVPAGSSDTLPKV